MKNGGVIRMDEVGRIVVPKEIRKLLNLGENRLVELYIEGDKLVIKRYFALSGDSQFFNDLCEKFAELYFCACIMGDCEKVLYSSKNFAKQCLDKKISEEFKKLILNGQNYLSNPSDGGRIVKILQDIAIEYHAVALTVIDLQQFPIGFIALISLDREREFSKGEVINLSIAKHLILSATDKNKGN